MTEHLHDTLAVCPECLKTLKADVFADADGAVWMTRTCPEHGQFDAQDPAEKHHPRHGAVPVRVRYVRTPRAPRHAARNRVHVDVQPEVPRVLHERRHRGARPEHR